MIEKAVIAIQRADAMLITAGAGMGVDSGLPDFRGNEGFWRAYPAIRKRQISFQAMANPKWFERDPRLAWGFYGHRFNLYQRTQPHTGFTRLKEMSAEMAQGCFVLTSNVDGQFQAAGFDPDRLEECHGSIQHLQCTRPCNDTVWRAEDLVISVDSELLHAVGPLPSCPRCGALARPNILMFGDASWIGQRTKAQEERLWHWLEALMVTTQRLVIVEAGAGQAVPTIRQRSEFYARVHHATLIRINPDDACVPHGRHISLTMGGKTALEAIGNAWREGREKRPDTQQA